MKTLKLILITMLFCPAANAIGLAADYIDFLRLHEIRLKSIEQQMGLGIKANCPLESGGQLNCLREILQRQKILTAREATVWLKAVSTAAERDVMQLGRAKTDAERFETTLSILENMNVEQFQIHRMIPLTAKDYVEWTGLQRSENELVRNASQLVLRYAQIIMKDAKASGASLRGELLQRFVKLTQEPRHFQQAVLEFQVPKLVHFVDMDLRRVSCHLDARQTCPEMTETECHQIHSAVTENCAHATTQKVTLKNLKELKNFQTSFSRCARTGIEQSIRQKFPACRGVKVSSL